MAYFYGAMGVAMLAGVMAVFEMGLSLTGQSLLPKPEDPYFTKGALNDQSVLNAIDNVDLSEYLWCDNLTRELGADEWKLLDQVSGDQCILSKDVDAYQAFVRACQTFESGSDPYAQLFSCVDPKEGICNFEFRSSC